MRVVVDTNVFIKALFFNEKWPKRILQEEANGKLKFIMSFETQKELTNTILHIAIMRGASLEEFKTAYKSITSCLFRSISVVPKKKHNLSKHNSDNKFIDCAVAGDCTYIIAEDDHLLSLGQIKLSGKKSGVIKIVPPYQYFLVSKFNR